ncbi:MAG: hypothetical protein KBC73_04765 [Burkholderiaceae bacterium]|nr:hypothetical protein [Burkholderiaceae bacterium]
MAARGKERHPHFPLARPLGIEEAHKRICGVPAIQEGAIGYVPSFLALLGLPHTEPITSVYERDGGRRQLRIVSDPALGVPYGHVARIWLIWISTRIVQTKSRCIDLAPSQSAFFRSLGIRGSRGDGGSIVRYANQLDRLCRSLFIEINRADSPPKFENHLVARKGPLFGECLRNGSADLVLGQLLVPEEYFLECTQHAVPIDLRAVAATRSTVRLDLYMFLTYRLNSLRRPVRLPWSALLAQIGIQPPEGNAAALRSATARLRPALRDVLLLYPEARVQMTETGVELRPSPPAVPRREQRCG